MLAQPGADAPTAIAFLGHQAHGPAAGTTTSFPLDTPLLQQWLEHRLVVSLASRYQGRHGSAVPVGAHMDLGAEPTAAAASCFAGLASPGSGSMLVGAHDRAVEEMHRPVQLTVPIGLLP
jgi:hypothetical protein